MPRIHYLNVKNGDCSIIEHSSGNVTVIDVCCAAPVNLVSEFVNFLSAQSEKGVLGNFRQKEHPTNPIAYAKDRGIKRVFRYIQTHPDMDHMDGIKAFFENFNPVNFWDTANKKSITFSAGSPYSEDDWKFYVKLRDASSNSSIKRLELLSGASGEYFNKPNGGDGLSVLAPTKELMDEAIKTDDYNDACYVILYKKSGNKILFGADSHDKTWKHILNTHRAEVSDIDLLIAPHHGRKSDRNYEFLDVLKPKMTFFGNASSEHLAYGNWNSRNLPFITNNQANCMVVDASIRPMNLYVTNENFARAKYPRTSYSSDFKAWYIGTI